MRFLMGLLSSLLFWPELLQLLHCLYHFLGNLVMARLQDGGIGGFLVFGNCEYRNRLEHWIH